MPFKIQLTGPEVWEAGNFTSADACFDYPPETQVACAAQFLNITDPPSEYDYRHYPFLWDPVSCMLANVTYAKRVDIPDNFNWCSVPLKGSDAFLFAALALVCAAVLFGKLSAVWVLIAGGVVGAVNNYVHLREVSNAITIWLGISPPDLFFFAFLPPLLVDSAIRIDFFMFSKLFVHIVLMAFVMVVLTAVVLTPLILFVLGFSSRGFTWVHGALISAMVASTDALAASAVLKGGGGPEKLVILMEGEALLNDASAITLFEVFMHLLEQQGDLDHAFPPSVWPSIPVIIEETLKLASIGAAVGWAMSVATGYLLRWLRWRGARPAVDNTIILAVAYLAFYVGQSPAQGSGVISVVVYGLWGNYTSKWGMLASTVESGSFDAFWDTLTFASNGLVFFWAGVASINYFLRSIDVLGAQAWSYAAIPCIYIFMMLIRTGCLALFNLTFFRWIRERLTWAEVAFTGWCGLRGAISLIMAADFIAHSAFLQGNPEIDRVNSDIAIWTASFVLLTLLINAPTIPMAMHWLKLDVIPHEKQAMRAKAKRALVRFTGAAIDTLRDDDEEFLQGANWEAVASYTDVSGALKKFDPPPPPPGQQRLTAAALDGGAAAADGKEGAAGGSKDVSKRATTEVEEPAGMGGRHKSLGHSMANALLSPFMAAAHLATGGAAAKEEAGAAAAAAAEEGVVGRSQRSGGGGASSLLAGLVRASSFHQLALLGGKDKEGKEERSRRSRSRGAELRRKASSRSVRSRQSRHSGYATESSGSESDVDDSDTFSSSDGLGSEFGSDGSADGLLGEVVEECPFIKGGGDGVGGGLRGRGRSRARLSLSSDDAAEDPRHSPRPGERRGKQQQQQQQQAGDVEMGLTASASPAPDTLSAVAAAAAAAAAASATAASAVAAAPRAAPAAAGAPAAESSGEEEVRAEDLDFVRQVQARQKAQAQHRPTLGALFAPPPAEAETPPSPRVRRQHGSSTGLSTITENGGAAQPDVQAQRGWHQRPSAAATPAAAGSEGDELYYSFVPAALGRALQQQLKRELEGQEGGGAAGVGGAIAAPPAAAAAAPSAAAAAPEAADTAPSGSPRHALGSPTDELYYSSVPAAMGRQLQQQLRQQLAAEPQQRDGVGEADGGAVADAPRPSAESPPSGGAAGAGALPAGYYSSVPAAVGRHMGRQLQAELAAAAATASAQHQQQQQQQQPGGEPSSGMPPGSPRGDDYYSSMPAAVGRRFAEQLATERAAAAASERAPGQTAAARQAAQRAPPAGEDAGSELPAEYYSSLPAAAGRTLQQELQKQLAAQQPQRLQQQQQAQQQQRPVVPPPAPPPAAEEPPPDAYSTLPASLGRSMQRELSRELQRQQAAAPAALTREPGSSGSSRGGSLEPSGSWAGSRHGRKASADMGRPPRPSALPHSSSKEALGAQTATAATAAGVHPALGRPASRGARLPPAASRRPPAWEDYHATVTGAAGPSLAAELQRQLAARKATAEASSASSVGPLTAMPQRDLLGRRIAPASAGSPSVGSASPAGIRDLSTVLPLSDRASLHHKPGSRSSSLASSNATAASASILPAATPVAAQLQLRRDRILLERSRTTPRGTPSSRQLDGAMAASAAAGQGTRDDALARLNRRSGSWPARQDHDTSWQHKPLRVSRSDGPGVLHRGAASLAPPSEHTSEEGEEQHHTPEHQVQPPSGLAHTTSLLVRTYSNPAADSLGTSGKMGGRHRALSRVSPSAPSRDASQHGGGGAYSLAMAAAGGSAHNLASFREDGVQAMSAGALAEMRSRLIAGLKRYFHAKRMEGLLSVQGLRILEYACDHAAEHTDSPLRLWGLLEKEVKGNLTTRTLARCLMAVARSWRAAPHWVQAATRWPVKKISGFLRSLLGRRMLVSCEVAVEYYLSLIHSPQIQWMQQTDEAWPLQQEVEGEVDTAYRFIIDREIEAPDRFGAIQSYRAAMAVLRQQLTFVHELYESGMVDAGEKDDMMDPLDKRMRHLEITGPVWKPPRPRAVLRGLPFMQSLPEELFKSIVRSGSIKEYKTGETFWAGTDVVARSGGESGPGAFVVLSGVIRRVHVGPDGTKREYFQGIGGVVGSLLALTGTRMPGSDMAVAEGNTLGKGPMLFHWPQSAVHYLLQQAAAGEPAAVQLRLQLVRLAAACVVETCEQDVVRALELHLLHLAAAKADRSHRRHATHRHGSGHASVEGGSPRLPHRARFGAEGEEEGGSEEDVGIHHEGSEPPALGRSTSQQRLSGDGGKRALREQAAPAAGGLGLRSSKSFGGHLAELMQQIAQEEFEELNGPQGDQQQQQHLEQVEEGEEVASPHVSEATGSLAGGSAADLPGMAAAVAGGEPGRAAASNGHAPGHRPHHRRHASSDLTGTGVVVSGRAARVARGRARAAARRAPQYAAEVLTDIKRGLPSAVLLELPPGAPFSQTTHAVLLRGQLAAEQPPTPLTSPPVSPRVSGGRRTIDGGWAAAGGGDGAGGSLHRASMAGTDRDLGWEAELAAAATALAAPTAPRTLPWLGSARFRCNAAAGAAARAPQHESWTAGGEGALLLVWLTEGGDVPAGVRAARELAAELARHAAKAQATAQAASSLRSFPLDPASGPSGLGAPGLPSAAAPGASAGGGDERQGRATAQRLAPVASMPRPSGFMRLMPWQHRYSTSRHSGGDGDDAPGPAPADVAPAGDGGSADGSGRGGATVGRSLRVPLDRLASRGRTGDAGTRTINSAR